MRHRRKGRVLGRSPAHQRALLRNLTSALFLTEGDFEGADNAPKTPGRIVTTLEKAKEVRPVVEKCITIARKALVTKGDADKYATTAARNTDAWKSWRKSPQWRQWAEARAPIVNARRRVFSMLRDKQAVDLLFEKVAPRYADRPGGYTRIMRLAKPRLGDAGTRAVLELVGVRDRVTQRSQAPAFESDAPKKSEPAAAT